MTNTYSLLRTAALAAALSLGLGAASASAQEVKLGLLIGFTGDMGPWAPALNNAAILAVEEINAAGGILGQPVQLISEDNASTVSGAVRGAQKLVSVDQVSAIIGPESDPIVALLQFARDNEVPVISTSGGTEALDEAGGTGTFIYRTNASDSFLGVVHARMILDELGIDEVVIVVENLEGTLSAADTFARNFESFGGTVKETVTLSSGQTNYLSEIGAVAGAEPELVFLSVGQTTGINFVRQAYQRGYDWSYWVTTDLQNPDFVNGVGVELAQGISSAVSSQVEESESWERFAAAYLERFGEAPEPGFYQAETYDAFIAVALAMVAAGETGGAAVDANLLAVSTPEGEKVISYAEGVEALEAGLEIDYDGASGPLDFNAFGNVTVPATRLLEVNESGEWVVVTTVDSSAFPAG